jgi:hypothetical protein
MRQEALAFLDTLPSGMFGVPKGRPVARRAQRNTQRVLGGAAQPDRRLMI